MASESIAQSAGVEQLITRVTELIAELDEVTRAAEAELAKVPQLRRRQAENLLHYAHLRTIDIRSLQNGLHDLGVTSLGSAESFTKGRLQIALHVLHALAGKPSDINVAELIAADAHFDEARRS